MKVSKFSRTSLCSDSFSSPTNDLRWRRPETSSSSCRLPCTSTRKLTGSKSDCVGSTDPDSGSGAKAPADDEDDDEDDDMEEEKAMLVAGLTSEERPAAPKAPSAPWDAAVVLCRLESRAFFFPRSNAEPRRSWWWWSWCWSRASSIASR